MILLVHMLFGALIASAVDNIILAIILAFLSHYFLDLFPHNEYSTNTNERNQFAISKSNIAKVFADFSFGILFILILSGASSWTRWLVVYACAIVATLPDGLALINAAMPNKALKIHEEFHTKKVHFLKYKKISTIWRILTQVLIFIIIVILLKRQIFFPSLL